MTPVSGLLVDMDGTLVDTGEANYEAYAAALRAVGVSVARDAFDEAALGKNWRQFLPALLGAARSGADPAAVAAHKAEIYPGTIPLTRVNHALVALIRTGRPRWRTALVTTASRPSVAAVLRHHGLEDLFDTIVTGSEVTRHKPDPEAYHLAAARLDLSPADCLVVEDSDVGVASAAAFGARCLRICFPSGPMGRE
ncbi:MAG: HAD family phosphatase [Gemmatimonadetes bacterium]|nr:HAD family phosphatase [Gemmatimonadota bacterium]